MVLCKYFAQGRCRFGERCYNEHIVDNRYRYQDSYENHLSSNLRSNNQDHYSNNLSNRSQDHSSYNSSNRYRGHSLYYSPSRTQDRSSYHSPNRYTQNESFVKDNRYYQHEDSYGYNKPHDETKYTWSANNSAYEYCPSRYDSPLPRQYTSQTPVKNKKNSFQRESPSPSHQAFQNNQNRPSRYDSMTSKSAPIQKDNRSSSEDSGIHLTKNQYKAFNEPKDEKENISNQNKFVDLVKEDMAAWQEGKQWPFSCYIPIKGHPQFPDFNDISPEELRYEAYEAEKNNNFPAHVKSTLEAMNTAKEKRNVLRKPTPETIKLIMNFYNQRTDLQSDESKTFNFGSGFPTENSSISKNQSSGVLFEKTTSSFTSSGGGFNLRHLSSEAPRGTPSSISKAAQMTENLKSASESAFRFALPKKSATDFSFKLPETGIASKDPSKHSIYTPLEDLTAEEREAFEAPVFVLGKIPTRPPPFELCF